MTSIVFVNNITEKDTNINSATMLRIVNEIYEQSGIQYFDSLYCPALKTAQPDQIKVYFYPFAGHVSGEVTGNQMVYLGDITGLLL